MKKMEKITVSLIKADVGGFPGHSTVPPELKEKEKKQIGRAKKEGLIVDYRVLNAGDDLQLVMSHRKSVDAGETKMAKELKLHGAGQDLLVDAFSGNIGGTGSRISAEMDFPELGFRAIGSIYDYKTEHGAFKKASILFITSSFISYVAQNDILFILSVFSLALSLILYDLRLIVLIIKELRGMLKLLKRG